MAKGKPIRLASILRQDRMGDFKAANSQLEAITANLRTTGQGIGGQLTRSQNRQLEAISKYTKRSTGRADASLAASKESTRDRYGTAMGGVTKTGQRTSERTLLATEQVANQQKLGAGALARGGQLGLKIEKQGAAEAASSAKYAMATALKYRAQQDAQMVYQNKQALRDYRLKREQLGLGPNGDKNSSLQLVAANAPADVYAVNDALENGLTTTAADGTTTTLTSAEVAAMSPAALAEALQGQLSITDPGEASYMLQVIKNIKGGATATEAAAEAGATLFGQEKNYDASLFKDTMATGYKASAMNPNASSYAGMVTAAYLYLNTPGPNKSASKMAGWFSTKYGVTFTAADVTALAGQYANLTEDQIAAWQSRSTDTGNQAVELENTGYFGSNSN